MSELQRAFSVMASASSHTVLLKALLVFQADVVIKFPDEEAPSTVLSQNLFTPKQEIQVYSKGVIHSAQSRGGPKERAANFWAVALALWPICMILYGINFASLEVGGGGKLSVPPSD